MTKLNIYRLGRKLPDLCTILGMVGPARHGTEKTLMLNARLRLWTLGYTTIEAKEAQEDGSCGLSLAVRKNADFRKRKIMIDRSFIVGEIERFKEGRQLHAILDESVYITCLNPVNRDAYNRLCKYIRRAV